MTSGPGEIDPNPPPYPPPFPALPSPACGGWLGRGAGEGREGVSERSGGASFSAAQVAGQVAGQVTFDRRELGRIFGLYGRKVAEGEWRDYSIDFLKDRAVFSIFRRSSEIPIYRIEKNSQLALRQGIYSVISATGLIVRRGHELDRVLRAIDRSLRLVPR
jgi:Protein of unknown function (DUF2794)